MRYVAAVVLAMVLVRGCTTAAPANELDQMQTARLTINGQVFEVWVARSFREKQRGLMNTEADALAPTEDGARRGMLFVFSYDQPLAFWMKDTIIDLDIAYIRSDGRIVKTYTMRALDEMLYPSVEPAQYALEVLAGTFEELGIGEGDVVVLPEGL